MSNPVLRVQRLAQACSGGGTSCVHPFDQARGVLRMLTDRGVPGAADALLLLPAKNGRKAA